MAKDEKKTKALQRRRLRAGRLLLKGVPQAEVARCVGVSRATVCEWNARLQRDGLEALRRRPRGRPAGLDAKMRGELAKSLKAGAMAHGFATELWTLSRISRLIKQQFGVKYSEAQVWRILGALGWSCQRPTGRARERDEAAIRQWKEQRWPALRKTPEIKAGPSSSSTSPD
jgi:transposase